jgi:hypothetical protein
LIALIGFWALAVAGSYAKACRMQRPFSANGFFVLDAQYSFNDFTNFDPVTERMKSIELPTIVYPAPMMCGYLIFTRLFAAPLRAYLVFIGISVAVTTVVLALALSACRSLRVLLFVVVGVSVVLSFPLLFLVERGNMESIVWLLLALGLVAFLTRHYTAAALAIALAASMKLFPGVLLLLLVAKKRYRDFAVSIVAIAIFTLVALQLLGPSIPVAAEEVITGLKRLNEVVLMKYRPFEIRVDHSFFSVIKQILHFANRNDPATVNLTIQGFGIPYALFALPGFAAIYWFRIRKLPLLNQVIALIVFAVTIPYVSFEYTLVHVYLLWGLFLLFLARDVATGRAAVPLPAALAMLTAFAFVFAPDLPVSYAGQLKTCALLILLLVSLTVPIQSPLFD